MFSEVVADPEQLRNLREAWTSLLPSSKTNEPTLSPTWLLNWWHVFGKQDGRQLRAVAFWHDSRLVGLAPLCSRRVWVRPGLPMRRLELLGSGERQEEEICSDYLGILAESGREQAVARELSRCIRDQMLGPWDDVVLPAMDGKSPMPILLAEALAPAAVSHGVTATCPFIPLPASFETYLDALSSNHRYLVRRSLRDFDKWAGKSAKLKLAHDRPSLAQGVQVLKDLHSERWSAADRAGVFAAGRFTEFHERVMPELLDQGALELLWLEARGKPIAAQYNLVWHGKVHFYQGGRSLEVPKQIRPGIVMHAHAIRRSIELGRSEYDFLAGASRYKEQLASDFRPLVTIEATRLKAVARLRAAAEFGADVARKIRSEVSERFSQKRARAA